MQFTEQSTLKDFQKVHKRLIGALGNGFAFSRDKKMFH